MSFIAQSTTTNAPYHIKESRICRLHWSWFSALRICPLYSKILAAAFLASYRWSSAWILPNCIVCSEIAPLTTSRHSSASHNPHPPLVANDTDFQKVYSHSVVTAYSLKVSVNSIAQCKDPTVIGTFAIILWAMITVCGLEIQLALLKPLANFFTPILFYSHAFQFVHNL